MVWRQAFTFFILGPIIGAVVFILLSSILLKLSIPALFRPNVWPLVIVATYFIGAIPSFLTGAFSAKLHKHNEQHMTLKLSLFSGVITYLFFVFVGIYECFRRGYFNLTSSCKFEHVLALGSGTPLVIFSGISAALVLHYIVPFKEKGIKTSIKVE